MKYIPDSITLLPEIPEYASLAVPITEVLKKGQMKIAVGRVLGKKKAQRRIKQLGICGDNDLELEYSHKYTLRAMPSIGSEGKRYDLAISFLTPHYFVAEKVEAKKKIAWIHTDYSVVAVDRESQVKMWDKYGVIASISENVTTSFLKTFPELKKKVQIIANIMPMSYMKELTNAFDASNEMLLDGCIKLLSIGRFCTAKNFDNIPAICKDIRQWGINAKWYIIGFGGDEALIRARIKEFQMEEYVILLGKKENPYPYIKACDIYVQPSRYEGKCVSVIEAQILNRPVVITNYATSASQLEEGEDGIIVPMDNAGCAQAIVDLIKNKDLCQRLIENTKKRDYSNSIEIQKICNLME